MKKNITQFLDLKSNIINGMKKNGGWVNSHVHLDRAFTLTKKNVWAIDKTLQEKWFLNDGLKKKSSVDDIYSRMALGIELMLEQGVQAIGSFIDVDEVVEDKAIKAAQKIKDCYKKDITIRFINQTLKGVIDKKARRWFEIGAEFVDIVGGLPSKDRGHEEEHLEIILETAKKQKKMVHVHVDQLNSSQEKETELLAKKTIEFGMEGKVVAVHGISVAAHKKPYRQKLYKLIKKARLMFISCPSAWIDSRRSEKLMVSHNAVTPVDEMVPAGILISLGTDNIYDIYKPFSDGQMWTELRFLLESCHYYKSEQLIKIGSANGLNVLGLE